MAPLSGNVRAALRDSAFAYIDSKGRRRLPINDAPHVRNALARFDQTTFEDGVARERARQRLLRAARKFGITPIGFVDGQLRKERRQGESDAKAARFARLPRGVVTFLLADVEGSTRLAARLGDDWPELLNRLWRLIRVAVRRAAGDEVDIRGDEYLAVFRRAADAVTAAATIQRRLNSSELAEGLPLRVRIGLHTGQPTVADAAYVGIVLHTVARVCSAGHGGQILLSSASAQVLKDAPLPEFTYRALGRYALAGLPRAEPLFQLQASGLLDDFPKLRVRAAGNR
jgi:class 3 adenylate cyclase